MGGARTEGRRRDRIHLLNFHFSFGQNGHNSIEYFFVKAINAQKDCYCLALWRPLSRA
jgi:hypothetical protein